MKKKLIVCKTQKAKRKKRECCYKSIFPHWPKISQESSVIITKQLSKLIDKSFTENSSKKTQVQGQQQHTKNAKKKSPFVIGLQEVTKAVKRDLAEFVLVTELPESLHFTHYLLALCIEKKIPVGSVQRLSNKISHLFHIRSAMVIAILKDSHQKNEINKIKSRLKLASLSESSEFDHLI